MKIWARRSVVDRVVRNDEAAGSNPAESKSCFEVSLAVNGVGDMEQLIGTIMISGRVKQVMVEYRLFFTDSRMLAIDTGQIPSIVHGPPGISKGIAQGMESIRIMNIWEGVVMDFNTTHKPLVSYEEKLSDELLGLPSISIPYDKVKSVEIKKATRDGVEASKVQYQISLSTGMFSHESFLIPGVAADEVTSLLKKTPLAVKIKG